MTGSQGLRHGQCKGGICRRVKNPHPALRLRNATACKDCFAMEWHKHPAALWSPGRSWTHHVRLQTMHAVETARGATLHTCMQPARQCMASGRTLPSLSRVTPPRHTTRDASHSMPGGAQHLDQKSTGVCWLSFDYSLAARHAKLTPPSALSQSWLTPLLLLI
jgi:hypothetical protein